MTERLWTVDEAAKGLDPLERAILKAILAARRRRLAAVKDKAA